MSTATIEDVPRPYGAQAADPNDCLAVQAAAKIEGWMTLPELRWLAQHARNRHSIVEIGAWLGRSTLALGLSCRGHLTTVDIGADSGGRHLDNRRELLEANLEAAQRQGFRIAVDWRPSTDAALLVPDDSLDMVFIDGDHSLPGVEADIRAWLPKLKTAGLLCGHDYAEVAPVVDALLPYAAQVPGTSIWEWAKTPGAILKQAPPVVPFLGVPVYDNISPITLAAFDAAKNSWQGSMVPFINRLSLLCRCFNGLWAEALNRRETDGVNRFVLLHSDIGPVGADWMTRLLHLLDEHELDALSVVSPIKDTTGDTSTAYEDEAGIIYRLKKAQIRSLPETFSAQWFEQVHQNRLLVNTGCLALRLDRPWCEEFHFEMRDYLVRDEEGKFHASGVSEDWVMSQWFHDRGIPYGVTRAIKLQHLGTAAYES